MKMRKLHFIQHLEVFFYFFGRNFNATLFLFKLLANCVGSFFKVDMFKSD